MKQSGWDDATCRCRIRDAERHERYPAGSPDADDLAAYAGGLVPTAAGRILVLGMTPELRTLALAYGDHVIAADANADVIALYRDWVSAGSGQCVELLQADWFSLGERGLEPFDYILGDGIFGNLPDLAAHVRLLDIITGLLKPHGRFITRMALVPDLNMLKTCDIQTLIGRFRAGEIDEAELGLTLRLFGFYAQCFDPARHLLDNRCVFEHLEASCRAGRITAYEQEIARRYYYGGLNCLLPRAEWEALLTRAGFSFCITTRPDRLWRRYYPVYVCRR